MTVAHCEEVIRLLWQYMDRELDGATARRLDEHLRRCRECSSRHDFEVRLRAIIRTRCGGEVAPEPLRRRVLALLRDMT